MHRSCAARFVLLSWFVKEEEGLGLQGRGWGYRVGTGVTGQMSHVLNVCKVFA